MSSVEFPMTKMTSAPVFFTLAQVRFNQVLALESYVPQIQDQLRRKGYPDTQKVVTATFNLNMPPAPNDAAPQSLPVSQTIRHTFSTIDKKAGFILDQGSLSFQTMEYDVFETFSQTLLGGLRIVHDAVSLSYTDRIGMRYLDAVYPNKGEDLSEYLNESVIGLYRKLAGELLHSFSETRVKDGHISIVARIIVQDGRIGFPPDMQPIGLELLPRFQELYGMHAILDTDASHDARATFDLGQIESRLLDVHDSVTKSFNLSVTKHALKAWE
jgi:uncharacterized protein (TIGR04255 family)